MAQLTSLLGEQATVDCKEQKCRLFLHQRKHQFWWSAILLTGITKTSLCAQDSFSIPIVYTDFSIPQVAVLKPLKNSQNQQDPWSADPAADSLYSLLEFTPSYVLPAGSWVLPLPLISHVTFSSPVFLLFPPFSPKLAV